MWPLNLFERDLFPVQVSLSSGPLFSARIVGLSRKITASEINMQREANTPSSSAAQLVLYFLSVRDVYCEQSAVSSGVFTGK